MGKVISRREVSITDISGESLAEIFSEEIIFGPDGKIHIQFGKERRKTDCFTALTDSHLSCDGNNIILTKEFTKFLVVKNEHGVVVDIEAGEQTVQEEKLPLSSCYGHVELVREGVASDKPCFYGK